MQKIRYRAIQFSFYLCRNIGGILDPQKVQTTKAASIFASAEAIDIIKRRGMRTQITFKFFKRCIVLELKIKFSYWQDTRK